ncbi:MAG: MarR family transcriptional regulator [Micrococcales bacterium]|nr:MarR family transcriptional regulator [Micrococcales bacterium]
MDRRTVIRSLVVSANKLGRIAALSTGNTTPAAVWRTLSILRSEGPMRIGELAAASRVSQPGMTRLIAQLAQEELIARIADSDDARAWQVRLAAKGEAALAAWQEQLGAALEPLFDGLGAEDWRALERAADVLDRRTRAPKEAAA